MPSSATPQTNETLAPYQFDGGVAAVAGSTALSASYAGLKAWTSPLISAGGTTAALTTGSVFIGGMTLPSATTYSNIVVYVTSAASLPSTTQSFAGLYYVNTSSTAALVASSTAFGAASTTTGFHSCALTSAFTTSNAGLYYVALLVAGTGTSAGFAADSATSATIVAGPGAAAASYPYAINTTGNTALPATLTLSSSTLTNAYSFWAGLS